MIWNFKMSLNLMTSLQIYREDFLGEFEQQANI